MGQEWETRVAAKVRFHYFLVGLGQSFDCSEPQLSYLSNGDNSTRPLTGGLKEVVSMTSGTQDSSVNNSYLD